MTEKDSVVTIEPEHETQARPASTSDTLPEIVEYQLRALQAQHQAVLSGGSVEAIHKMRVATRRLQASLDLLEVKSGNLKTPKLKNRLREWRRRLSTVRNYDVFLQLISLEAPSRKAGRGEQFATLVSVLQEKRGKRISEVQDYLSKADIPKFAARLGITLPPLPKPTQVAEGEGEAIPVKDEAGEAAVEKAGEEPVMPDLKKWPDDSRIAFRAADRIDQRLAEFQALAAQAHATTHPRELHELRLSAKRLRYLLEIASSLGHGDASRALISLRSIQDRIGDWHDLEALEEEIISTVSKRKFLKKHLSESAHLILAAEHLEKKKSALVKRLFPIRVARSVPATSQKLARALRRSATPPKAASEPPVENTSEE